jgi:hypothetical protein
MKKMLVLCIVLAAALISGSLYASKPGNTKTKELQLHSQEVVKCNRQVDLFPSLFFF